MARRTVAVSNPGILLPPVTLPGLDRISLSATEAVCRIPPARSTGCPWWSAARA
jgi:hypothetical protein